MPDNKHLPAYPQPITSDSFGNTIVSWDKHTDWSGLTKREKIAAMLLQGYCSNPRAWEELTPDEMAQQSIQVTDMLLTHLQNTEQ